MRLGPLKIKLQLVCGDVFAIGPGKADLLEAIDKEQSISGAGRALGMSYRRTWLLVDEMNRTFRDKLIETLSGGGKQRGARVTDFGHSVLAAYRAVEADAAGLAESKAYAALSDMVLDTPRASKVQSLPPES